jgi:hypothetical protein
MSISNNDTLQKRECRPKEGTFGAENSSNPRKTKHPDRPIWHIKDSDRAVKVNQRGRISDGD